ncbi:MAG: choice-of-anchor R domain-containing protein [bacterium]|nr:choice-of-anchor R domain-containing protein [bacterium]
MRKTAQRGQALLIILLVMAVALTIALSIASRSIADITISQKEEEAARAFSAAEAGIEQALITQSGTSGGLPAGGQFTATITSLAEGGTNMIVPILLASAETIPIWFVAHDGTGALTCPEGGGGGGGAMLKDSFTGGGGHTSNATVGKYDSSSHRRKASAFRSSSTYIPTRAEFEVDDVHGNMNGDTKVQIWTDSGGRPGSLISNATFSAKDPKNPGYFGGTFPTPPTTQLVSGTQYWLVMESSTDRGSTFFHIKGATSGGLPDGVKGDQGSGPTTYENTWNVEPGGGGETVNFKIYGDGGGGGSGNTCFSGNTIQFCWGESGTSSSSSTAPALEASILYTTAPGDYTKAKIARGAYDPNGARRATNKFAAADIGCTIADKSFAFGKTITLDTDLGIPQSVSSEENGLQQARVRLLYNTDRSHPLGLSVAFPGNTTLPRQGTKIESVGTAGGASNTTRKIELFQLFPDLPPVFDFGLFSGSGGLTK